VKEGAPSPRSRAYRTSVVDSIKALELKPSKEEQDGKIKPLRRPVFWKFSQRRNSNDRRPTCRPPRTTRRFVDA